ncbi:MAG: helix-turn-helix domain-containing protein [Acidimicrobiia bacterium]|nr:helix-turn-helix domain-containing protein [Acidimicrobiia bacterium]
MAQRLCFGERSRIEAMCEAQLSIAVIAGRAGRGRSTVHREVDRGGGCGGYCAVRAQCQASVNAARPKTPKLAGDAVLAAGCAGVAEGLELNWSPHAISADLKARGKPVSQQRTVGRLALRL